MSLTLCAAPDLVAISRVGHPAAVKRLGSLIVVLPAGTHPQADLLDHFVIFGERHLRHLLKEFMGHYLTERYHHGLGSQIIRPGVPPSNDNAELGRIARRSRLGGPLNYYCRTAA